MRGFADAKSLVASRGVRPHPTHNTGAPWHVKGGDDAAPRKSGANGPLTPPLPVGAMEVCLRGWGHLEGPDPPTTTSGLKTLSKNVGDVEVCGKCVYLVNGPMPASTVGAV